MFSSRCGVTDSAVMIVVPAKPRFQSPYVFGRGATMRPGSQFSAEFLQDAHSFVVVGCGELTHVESAHKPTLSEIPHSSYEIVNGWGRPSSIVVGFSLIRTKIFADTGSPVQQANFATLVCVSSDLPRFWRIRPARSQGSGERNLELKRQLQHGLNRDGCRKFIACRG